MAYVIEVIALGQNQYPYIETVINLLNKSQEEFIYRLPPERLLKNGLSFSLSRYKKEDVYEWLEKYRQAAKGNRRFVIAILKGEIDNNFFGGSKAKLGLAYFSTNKKNLFNKSPYAYIAYFIIRYSLKFVSPEVKNHEDTRGCFYDYMGYKPDIGESLKSLRLCDECSLKIQPNFNEEIYDSIFLKMSKVIKRLELWWWFYKIKFWFAPQKAPNEQVDNSWLFTSISLGIAASLLVFYLSGWFELSLIIFLVVGIYVFLHNPKRRYFRLGATLFGFAALSGIPRISAAMGYKMTSGNPEVGNEDWFLKLDVFDEPLLPIAFVIAGIILMTFDRKEN
ncbi:hypothetical protein [Flavilitoribacter nigricans]|uniref:Uncharacterized protein n=1 Tax=Flavilitoribacter nigricans (strain ATCC 23147 / DSM 23189 / NBRC 102662 / NCIMB 1420 / SS-2) TaxID=1122177 RepID=A0A2D0N985_FLAN2|nr:hypothetical protein [Flavilitoribacter nigricans]PHN04343.1 hypothetical protein CRP01_22540 [Flavilitoribacter nigricans DSM 23189 = NBRC 102662]